MTAGDCTGSHIYAGAGTPTITVTATDDDAGTGSDSVTVTITANSVNASVSGSGWVQARPGRTEFSFTASSSSSGFDGQISAKGPGKARLYGSGVSALTVTGNTATWSGPAQWNGKAGYTYEVVVTDRRRSGSRSGQPDTFSLTVRLLTGAVVFSTQGDLRGAA